MSHPSSLHSLHVPYQFRSTHCFLRVPGALLALALGLAPVGVVCAKDVDPGEAEVTETEEGSLQPPNQPGSWHVLVPVGSEEEAVGVRVGAGAALGVDTLAEDDDVVVDVVVVGSLHPNHPGVLHVDVDVEELLLLDVVVVAPLVVDSSRHPHQPGVLHVSVLVRVELVVLLLVAVVEVPLLSKNFHNTQS